ncbi:MAG TPA: Smr/MutS family protein [Caulobacteraceae bacterium]|nr:Smr/MutS family protein [Caulobacteraceae bacterium]
MKRAPDVEDLRLWAVVTATVRPLRHAASLPFVGKGDGEAGRVGESDAAPVSKASQGSGRPQPTTARSALPTKGRERGREGPTPPGIVEPGLHRRLARGREALAARIDLHGMTQDAARAALTAFIRRSAEDGWRAVLVITGKGVGGDGILRRRAPDWLADPPIRAHVAGVSEAHRRHGGEGALYVALKRPR